MKGSQWRKEGSKERIRLLLDNIREGAKPDKLTEDQQRLLD
jgi:hypothetical protein